MKPIHIHFTTKHHSVSLNNKKVNGKWFTATDNILTWKRFYKFNETDCTMCNYNKYANT